MITGACVQHVDLVVKQERMRRAQRKSLMWLDRRDIVMEDMTMGASRNEEIELLDPGQILVIEGENPTTKKSWDNVSHLLRKRKRGGSIKYKLIVHLDHDPDLSGKMKKCDGL